MSWAGFCGRHYLGFDRRSEPCCPKCLEELRRDKGACPHCPEKLRELCNRARNCIAIYPHLQIEGATLRPPKDC